MKYRASYNISYIIGLQTPQNISVSHYNPTNWQRFDIFPSLASWSSWKLNNEAIDAYTHVLLQSTKMINTVTSPTSEN